MNMLIAIIPALIGFAMLGALGYIVYKEWHTNTENCNFSKESVNKCNWYDESYYTGCNNSLLAQQIVGLISVIIFAIFVYGAMSYGYGGC